MLFSFFFYGSAYQDFNSFFIIPKAGRFSLVSFNARWGWGGGRGGEMNNYILNLKSVWDLPQFSLYVFGRMSTLPFVRFFPLVSGS